jgi:hypothetical protein
VSKQLLKASFSKFDPAHLFDGLFMPMKGVKREIGKDGVLRRPRLLVPQRDFGGIKVGFQGFEQLGVDDQSVLLAIAARLGIDGLTIENNNLDPIAKQLRLGFDFEKEESSKLAAKKTTLRSLLIDAGYNPSKSTDIIKNSLNRLANAQIREQDGKGWDRRANLISVVFNEQTGETFIAANPRLTTAIFAEGQYVKISLFERNQLNSEVAKLLHAWLCSHIRPGEKLGNGNGAKIETLMPHIWGPYALSVSAKVLSVRRGLIKDALTEIVSQTDPLHFSNGWATSVEGDIIHVSRPKNLPIVEETQILLPSEIEAAEFAEAEIENYDCSYSPSKYELFGVKRPEEYSVRKNPRKANIAEGGN